MVAHINTIALNGIDCKLIDVQTMISKGMPSFTIVGLPNKSVGEAKDRVKAALTSIGVSLPPKKILTNLSPADIPKIGSHYDLPIAVGLMVELGIINKNKISNFIVVGELSLDGQIMKSNGVIAAALYAKQNNMGIICSKQNQNEAFWAANKIDIISTQSIIELIDSINNTITTKCPKIEIETELKSYGDLSEIKCQQLTIRAAEIAAIGRHNMLMIGSPGIGKTMIASRIRSIMPSLSEEEIIENNLILSICGKSNNKIIKTIPFIAPHHSISPQAMAGGGRNAIPGEVTMANNGILFLDEFPEFSSTTINTLRQPIETKQITITRVESQATYPANFQLIAAMNPCKCGNLYIKEKRCKNAPKCAEEYIKKINTPILDRIDIFVTLNNADPSEIFKKQKTIRTSEDAKKTIVKAREMQKIRYSTMQIKYNSELQTDIIDSINIKNEDINTIMQILEQYQMSFRSYNKVLKVARSIADMDESKYLKVCHIKEALIYRSFMEINIKNELQQII